MPTPAESAARALGGGDNIDKLLATKTTALGITNIRVIKRIARFLKDLSPVFEGMQQAVINRAVTSIALLGWSVFEPKFAPSLDFVTSHDRYSGLLLLRRSCRKKRHNGMPFWPVTDSIISANSTQLFLTACRTGGFDLDRVGREAASLNRQEEKALAHLAIRRPWDVLGSSFDDNEEDFKIALVESVENHGAEMTPTELNDVVGVLRELDDHANADRMIQVI